MSLLMKTRFVAHPFRVGTPFESGPELVNKIIEEIEFTGISSIVEIGPGDGPITRAALQRMPEDATLKAIEKDQKFYKYLSRTIRDPRFKIIHGDGLDIAQYTQKPDYIISGIPFANIKPEKMHEFLEEVRRMNPKKFIQYCYLTSRDEFYNKNFDVKKIRVEQRNKPTAHIYVCQCHL